MYFGKELIEKVPIFWSLIKDTIKITDDDIQAFYVAGDAQKPVNFDQANEMILCLQLVECAAVAIHSSLTDNLLELLPKLNLLLKHPLKAVSFLFSSKEWLLLLSICSVFSNSFLDSSHDGAMPCNFSFNEFIKSHGYDCKRWFGAIANH